jgi:hypothetical protein
MLADSHGLLFRVLAWVITACGLGYIAAMRQKSGRRWRFSMLEILIVITIIAVNIIVAQQMGK